MREDIDANVARLDGYLNGIASLSGRIRGYSAYAYLLHRGVGNPPVERLLTDFFSPRVTFVFDSIEALAGGMRDLEQEIQRYLVRSVLGVSDNFFEDGVLADRRKYLSFVVMDLIDPIVHAHGKATEVIRLVEKGEGTDTQSVFFCVLADEYFLVLQFNDNKLDAGNDKEPKEEPKREPKGPGSQPKGPGSNGATLRKSGRNIN
jgi:hypothetical protein